MNHGELFRIGVIAPYRAQADLIDKLLASEDLPNEVDVQVGTIHGFQGDECDIIFAVFNTPPTISSSKEMFLNKQNIINVSISRASDYRFIIMQDDETENISNLYLVKRVEQLMKETEVWTERRTHDLESQIFGDSHYLENNAFSMGHQNVNVYGLPEKVYEIRTEDSAVDIQIHRKEKRVFLFNNNAFNSSIRESLINDRTRRTDQKPNNTTEKETMQNTIPKELRNKAVKIQVNGTQKGEYYLVPYNGKLKKYTDKEVVSMFVPQLPARREKKVPVSVVLEDKIIYITTDNYKAFGDGLTDNEGIELIQKIIGQAI